MPKPNQPAIINYSPDNLIQGFDLKTARNTQSQLIQPTFLRIGIDEVKKAYQYRNHQHPDYEVLLIEHGDYCCKLNDKKLCLKPGSILIVKPGDWHIDYCQPPLRFFNVTFVLQSKSVNHEPISIFKDNIDVELQYFLDRDQQLIPIVKKLYYEPHNNIDVINANIRYAKLLEVFWLIIKALPKQALSKEFAELVFQNSFRLELFNFFDEKITSPLTVKKIAEKMGMSERALNDACQKYVSSAPAKAFLQYKMWKAKNMLVETAMTIKEVSAYLGYQNQYHFSKCFKTIFSVPPKYFKKLQK